jgi:hypothetical protein
VVRSIPIHPNHTHMSQVVLLGWVHPTQPTCLHWLGMSYCSFFYSSTVVDVILGQYPLLWMSAYVSSQLLFLYSCILVMFHICFMCCSGEVVILQLWCALLLDSALLCCCVVVMALCCAAGLLCQSVQHQGTHTTTHSMQDSQCNKCVHCKCMHLKCVHCKCVHCGVCACSKCVHCKCVHCGVCAKCASHFSADCPACSALLLCCAAQCTVQPVWGQCYCGVLCCYAVALLVSAGLCCFVGGLVLCC